MLEYISPKKGTGVFFRLGSEKTPPKGVGSLF